MTASTYNGWANYETWNVTLWIQNDEGLYNEAKQCRNYQELVNLLYDCGSKETPDGVKWDDVKIDGLAVNEVMKDLWLVNTNLVQHSPSIRYIMSQKLNATIYRQLFTDSQWDAISSALKDYADYGDEEANIADSIEAKITAIFNLTN